MDNGENSREYQDFFEKLRSNDGGPHNLRQIFEDDDKPLKSEANTSLRYQPQSQKQQQPQQQQRSSADGAVSGGGGAGDAESVENWSTVIAKVAHGYNGSDNMGRVGVALSRTEAGAVKLIVYKTKTQVLSTLLLTAKPPSIHAVILRETYMQFYDDGQHFWSVRFDTAKDEQDFIKAMQKLGVSVEQVSGDKSKDTHKNVAAPPPNSATSMPKKATPLPSPRQQNATTRAFDSSGEDEQSLEDIIVTPVRPTVAPRPRSPKSQALVPVLSSSSDSLSLALNPSATAVASNTSNVSQRAEKLELYIDEQRASGQVMEKKMDTILKAMSRLTSSNSSQLSESLDTSTTLSALSPQQDNEDELLELEQKLLNFKKENRALMKSLKAKEQALADLRSSTCALCEELLSQNSELKQQNSALLAAMTAQVNAKSNCSGSASTAACDHCEQSTMKIAHLERRVVILQNALVNCPADGSQPM